MFNASKRKWHKIPIFFRQPIFLLSLQYNFLCWRLGVTFPSFYRVTGSIFLLNFLSVMALSRLTQSQPTLHTHTLQEHSGQIYQENSYTHSTHNIYRAPTSTFITQYQVQRKPREYIRNSLSKITHTLLLTALTAQDKYAELTIIAVTAK